MVLVKKLRVFYLVGNRKLTDILSGRYPEHSKPTMPALTGIHSSNKATPPNSATPYELMGVNDIQTITLC